MKKEVLIGYEVGTGKEVYVTPDHLIVTGLTQRSGKTTTIESLIKRLGMKAIVFRTKLGEKSFISGTIIPPFFKDHSDWQFIQSLLEATLGEKLKGWDRSKIIQLSKGTHSLLEFKKRVDEALLNEKLRAFDKDILINLQAYLELVLPKLQSAVFSNELDLVDGINIIDLERFSRDIDVQSLVIRSTVEEVFFKYKNTVVILPEAPKFLPQERGNPCKQIVEQFIREGATDNKLLWIDSQDIASTDKTPLKQVSTWLLGIQAEINEVKHVLAQMPLPAKSKPKPDEIMTLRTGEFYVCTRDFVKKVYVLPFWLDEETARKVAMGKIKVEELSKPESLVPFAIARKQETLTQQPQIDFQETSKRFNKELNDMSSDFFNKIADVQEQINKIYTELFNLKNQPKQEIDEDTIVRKVLQKIPTANSNNTQANYSFDEKTVIAKVLAQIPKGVGSVIYEVAPQEKIKKDFLQEAKDKILSDISSLSNDAKKTLKYLESRAVGCTTSEICIKGFLLSSGAGGHADRINKSIKELVALNIGFKDRGGKSFGKLKDKIKDLLGTHEASQQEMDNLYNHILMELLK